VGGSGDEPFCGVRLGSGQKGRRPRRVWLRSLSRWPRPGPTRAAFTGWNTSAVQWKERFDAPSLACGCWSLILGAADTMGIRMRIVTAQALEQTPSLFEQLAEVLRSDGLVCFPCRRQYSIAASLLSEKAVLKLVQSKRRSGKAPSLVLIPNREALPAIVADLSPVAESLIAAFWPGQLTLMFAPSLELPSKVLKTILAQKKTGKIGVRVPPAGISLRILEAFGGPLLTSSANLSRKTGANSISTIRKSFAHTVDILIDAGDLGAGPPSTVVDLDSEQPRIVREGSIPAAQVREVFRQTGRELG
jgi:L-threonylcarbamoyladenylate synthase